MNRLYASPLRVYLLLGALAFWGIFSGFKLPSSLFPNSSKPRIIVTVRYGGSTYEEFLNVYGRALEEQMRSISTNEVAVETLRSRYGRSDVRYELEFKWGAQSRQALKETQLVVNSFASRMPVEVRDSIWVSARGENTGFLAISFYSPQRSLDDVYNIIEPILTPQFSKVQDSDAISLWNPAGKEVRVELNPDRMATLQLFPKDIERSISRSLSEYGSGTMTVGIRQIQIQMPRPVRSIEDFNRIVVPTPSGKIVHLSDVAKVSLGPKGSQTQLFKTSGAASLILFAVPRPGGNVKSMSEDIIKIVETSMASVPKDIQHKVLVDPSEFIRSAVNNVFHEVAIGAFLAVVILFFFIGSFKNTVTAAIEIPLSMVLAFILMRMSGMNLNLISLGGLALSAGMNVDASVVVMENIFRHFEENKEKLDFAGKLRVITQAVKEVQFAVMASTVSSLVVFLPLVFTSGLSYAILGDLAKTVVFSHGFSAFVALILVPTVRLHLMSRAAPESHVVSPIEPQIRGMENWYARSLDRFIRSPYKTLAYTSLAAVLALLVAFVLPSLPREIIGKPDSDWMILNINTSGNTLTRQMEGMAEEVEAHVLREYGPKIKYTFTEIDDPNSGNVMFRLKNKKDMKDLWKALEKKYVDEPLVRYHVEPWNPAELPIPDPPQLKISIRGGTIEQRTHGTDALLLSLLESHALPRFYTDPYVKHADAINLKVNAEQWASLRAQGSSAEPADLADMARIATSGRKIGVIGLANQSTDILLWYPEGLLKTPEDLESFPVGVQGRLLPFKALASVRVEEAPPTLYREDGKELSLVMGRQDESSDGKGKKDFLPAVQKIVNDWTKEMNAQSQTTGQPGPLAIFEDAEKDLNDALWQLGIALGLSIILIFLTLVIQFGDVVNAALVLVAVPLGFIGVLISLFVFRSTLSLNSVLGIILLNGIAVANSIILVDFLKRLVDSGMEPGEAAIEAGRKRLRPILITSLTTILGMLPIALGSGEGGKILQPLGIAVSGGLWVSMTLTLFVVPALQVSYLRWSQRRRKNAQTPPMKLKHALITALIAGFSCSLAQAKEMVSFDAALQSILERSTAVKTQEANVGIAEARYVPAVTSFLPSLSLSATQTNGQDYGFSPPATRLVSANASWNLFRFGADLAGLQAASYDKDVQSAGLESTVLKTESTGIEALIAAIQKNREVAVLEQLIEIESKSHDIAKQRYARGLLPLQDVQKVEIDLSNAQARLSAARIQEQAAEATLTSLLGHSDIANEWPWKDSMSKSKYEALINEKNPNLPGLPDWRSAESKVAAEDKRVSQAYRLMLPSVGTAFQYNWNAPLGGTMDRGWTAQLQLSVPLFDQLIQYSAAREQSYKRTTAEVAFEQTKREAQSTFTQSQASFKVALESAQDREKTLGISRKLYEDSLKRFQLGRSSTNDLFVDQTRLIDSELFSIQSWASAHIALVNLCHSLGQRIQTCVNSK